MKLLFDQNISFRILKHIPSEITTSHVKKEGLINAQDYEIWKFAKSNEFTIVTQDSDFNDLFFLNGFPPKILWFKTGNLRTIDIADFLKIHLEDINNFINNPELGIYEIFKFSN